MSLIEVKNLSKKYKVLIRKNGFWGTLTSLFYRKYDSIAAVDNITFSLEKGELVGYIGPNGAGKSTTIKMLSGILVPTSGHIEVAGCIPWKDRKHNAMRIGVVFGQRSQLYWDLPVNDTFDLYKRMYKISDKTYNDNVSCFMELLGLKNFYTTPVRQLSLGQKMRANIAIALLHDPDILYLDEPTIGLDVVAKNNIRKFITAINKEKKTTVILTTHDMDDIEQICDRIILINNGQLLFDGNKHSFTKKFGGAYKLVVDFYDEMQSVNHPKLIPYKIEGNRHIYHFYSEEISVGDAISFITRNYRILDLTYSSPDIEKTVRNIYENN